MVAGTVLQAAAKRLTAGLWADPQPNHKARIRLADLMAAAAILMVFGGGFAVYSVADGFLNDYFARRFPDWGAPLLAFCAPFAAAFLLWAAAAPLSKILFTRPTDNPVPMRKNFGGHTPWFAGYSRNRIYKVFITEEMLCAAKVGGSIDSENSSQTADPAEWVRTPWATLYERLDVTSPEFLTLDDCNAQIRFRDIEAVWLEPKKRWLQPSVTHSGRLMLTLADQEKCEFLLLGDIDGAKLRNQIRATAERSRAFAPGPLTDR
jgi:hypothetical protein